MPVFEIRMLGKMFGLRRDEVTEHCRKLHKEEIRNFYLLPSIIRMTKSRRMRLERHAAQMERRGKCVGYWCESQRK
jgi:hypothetical protein